MKDYFEDIKKEIDLKLLPLVDHGLEISTTYKTKEFYDEKKRLETIKGIIDFVLKTKNELINNYTKELSKIMFNVFDNFIIVTNSYRSILKEVFANEFIKREINTDKEIEKLVTGYSTKQLINAIITPSSCVSFSSYGPSTVIDHLNKKVYEKMKTKEYAFENNLRKYNEDEGIDDLINNVEDKREQSGYLRSGDNVLFFYGDFKEIDFSKEIIDMNLSFKPDSFYIAGISNDFESFGTHTVYSDFAFTPILKYIFEYMSASSSTTLSKQFMQL